MRRTVLMADDNRRMTILTGDQGTEVLDTEEQVIGTYGTDRHDEMVSRHQGEGWRITEDGNVRPEALAATPQPSGDGPGDGFHEVDLGISS